jgi:hypothetical protein
MATTKETVLARILIDDNTKVGFQSYARNAERAKKTTEAFRAHAVDKLVESLDQQVLAIGRSARELDLLKAATLSASDAEFEAINNLHDKIDVHNRATEAAIRGRKEAELQEAATKRIADAVNRTNNAYRDEAATVDMTSDELEIYRLKMMGASQAQLDSVMATQQATKEFRKQGSAAKGAHGQLRLMRGGLGQLGHQVQDVAVQLQMGQNALLILGQQGSQVASLFGQNGALIGAVLAVGAALGTYFAPKLFKTTDALKELTEASEGFSKVIKEDLETGVISLSDEMDQLRTKSIEAFNAAIALKMVNSVEAADEALAQFDDTLESLASDFGVTGARAIHLQQNLLNLGNEFKLNSDQARLFFNNLRNVSLGVDGSEKKILTLLSGFQALQNEGADPVNKRLATLVDKLQQLRIQGGEAAQQADTLRDVLKGQVPLTKAQTEALEKEEKQRKALAQTITDHVQSLRDEAYALYLGEDALKQQQLAAKGYTQSQIDQIFALEEIVRVKREANQAADDEEAATKKAKLSVDSFVTSLRESTQEIGLNADALTRLQGERLGVDPAVIESLIVERNTRLANVAAIDAAAQAEIDTQAAIDEVEASRKDLVAGIVAEADALRQSSMDLAIQQAALLGLGVVAQQQFDDAIQRIRDYEKAQEDLATKKTTEGKIEALRRSLLSEEEVLVESLNSRQQLIDNAEALTIINEQQAADMKLDIEADYHKKKNALLKEGTDEEILQGSKLTGHMLGQLGKQFSGVQANNKKMFAAQKAYKIAKATQNTFDAANEALASPYPWPLPQVFAATAVAAGLANVAAIKSSSFEGGGFTGTGGRSGGVDGKGGFPAILHPNETVIDHTKGQGGGITVVNNIDATGAGADVDMKIRAAMQQTSQQTILSIQDLMRRRRFG